MICIFKKITLITLSGMNGKRQDKNLGNQLEAHCCVGDYCYEVMIMTGDKLEKLEVESKVLAMVTILGGGYESE